MRRTLLLLALLVAPSWAPLASAQATVRPLDATGPDADGLFLLRYEITMEAAASPALGLAVTREEGGNVTEGARDLGARALPSGTSVFETDFLPSEGTGAYAVALVVDGAASAPLRFEVATGSGASREFAFDVADEPTRLQLTSDSVNGDGKLKSPGEELVTRATVEDANGLAELDGLSFVVLDAAGAVAAGGPLPWSPAEGATSAGVEHRFAQSPLPAGAYALDLRARKDGAVVANASRTFQIREVAPLLVGGNLSATIPDAAQTQTVSLVLADKNGAPGAGSLEVRLYRASTRVEEDGFAARFANGAATVPITEATRGADLDGYGRSTLPLAVTVPAGAAPGDYRASLYLDGSLLGSLPLAVLPLPSLRDATLRQAGDQLAVEATGAGDGFVTLRIATDEGATGSTTSAFVNGSASLAFPAPETRAEWNVTLHAREGGPAIAWRNGTWAPTAVRLELSPTPGSSRLPRAWRVDAPGWDLTGANASLSLTRWDGAAATRLGGAYEGGRVRVEGPADLEPGLYHVALTLRLPNGTVMAANASFEAGPWLRIELGEAVVQGREARVVLRNTGGVPLSRLVVDVRPVDASVALVVGGQESAPAADGTRHRFGGLDLPPGAAGELVVRLPDGPRPAGAAPARIRVFAMPGAAS